MHGGDSARQRRDNEIHSFQHQMEQALVLPAQRRSRRMPGSRRRRDRSLSRTAGNERKGREKGIQARADNRRGGGFGARRGRLLHDALFRQEHPRRSGGKGEVSRRLPGGRYVHAGHARTEVDRKRQYPDRNTRSAGSRASATIFRARRRSPTAFSKRCALPGSPGKNKPV